MRGCIFEAGCRILEAQREAIAMDGTVWCCRHPRWPWELHRRYIDATTNTVNSTADKVCVCVSIDRRGSPPTQKKLVLYLYLYTCNWLLVSRAACARAPARRLALRPPTARP